MTSSQPQPHQVLERDHSEPSLLLDHVSAELTDDYLSITASLQTDYAIDMLKIILLLYRMSREIEHKQSLANGSTS